MHCSGFGVPRRRTAMRSDFGESTPAILGLQHYMETHLRMYLRLSLETSNEGQEGYN